jgi:NADH:ubiquinone oxidoreductase subunit 5 (subunit L)/multisubunit Na+/H+ antiporter MnhA subunit
MELSFFLKFFILFPLILFLGILFIHKKKEFLLSNINFYAMGIQMVSILIFILFWIIDGSKIISHKEITLYKNKKYAFTIILYFDYISAVYFAIATFIVFLMMRYSRYYLHLEEGYKRFFNTVLCFYLGLSFTILAGNFETLFIGWEILGISSFLLIAFYRERYLPVRNAMKVFAVYRIGDIGILLAIWASHHLWHENISFVQLLNYDLVEKNLIRHQNVFVFVGICLLISAAVKSAQFPFSYWLPRAMEGPTPSSAIFYGSLSVHIGVFLMIRTFPFWEHSILVRVLVGLMGLTTVIISSQIDKVQSTIKTQIAYAAITQIGIMFIELALGLHLIVLIHFVGNAFLRTYQLLVSPSVVSYLIKEHSYHYHPDRPTYKSNFLSKISYTLYVLSIKEFNLDKLITRTIFLPLKKMGQWLDFFTPNNVLFIFVPLYLLGVFMLIEETYIPLEIKSILPEIFAFIGLLMVMKSFSEKKYPRLAWVLVIMNHFWIALGVSFNEKFDSTELVIYLSGVLIAGIVGFICLQILRNRERKYFDLWRYYGHSYQYPYLSLFFMLSTLGLMGFPISPTFLGEDLLFSHIHSDQFLLAFFDGLSFVLGGIALIRIFARLFLGPHIKTHHSVPLQAS